MYDLGETCLKHLSHGHPGVGTAFLFQRKGVNPLNP
jgi:hypothetical protein